MEMRKVYWQDCDSDLCVLREIGSNICFAHIAYRMTDGIWQAAAAVNLEYGEDIGDFTTVTDAKIAIEKAMKDKVKVYYLVDDEFEIVKQAMQDSVPQTNILAAVLEDYKAGQDG